MTKPNGQHNRRDEIWKVVAARFRDHDFAQERTMDLTYEWSVEHDPGVGTYTVCRRLQGDETIHKRLVEYRRFDMQRSQGRIVATYLLRQWQHETQRMTDRIVESEL